MQARELRQYQYFLILAQELNFSRAAEICCITQSALSQQISKLEESLGVKLLERGPRQVRLTQAGKVLLDGVQRMFTLLQETRNRAREAGGIEHSTLSIGMVEYSNVALLPGVLQRLQARHAGVRLARQELNPAAQVPALQRGQIDIGIACMVDHPQRMLPEDGSVSSRPLLSSGWQVIMHERHPLAHCEAVTAQQLCGERIITCAREVDPAIYDWLLKSCRRDGSSLDILYETCQVQAGLQMARQGLGCMLIAGGLAFPEPPDMRSIPLQGLAPLAMHMFWRTDESRPLVLDFMDIALETARIGWQGPRRAANA